MSASDPVRRGRLLAAAALLFTFLAGALTGVAYERTLEAREPDRVDGRGSRHGRRAMIFAPEGPLGERLDLTAGQRAQIERILEEDHRKARAIFREMKPLLKAQFESTTAAVRAVLTSEQQEEFDRYVAERRAELRKRVRGEAPGRRP